MFEGFLLCPKCDKQLTCSASKGRKEYYHYYHCTSACGVRYKAPEVNQKMIDELNGYAASFPKLELYSQVLISVFNSRNTYNATEVQELKRKLEEIENKQRRARNHLLSEDIKPDNFRQMKAEMTEKARQM